MKIVKIKLFNPDINSIKMAVNVLKNGGLIVYPTDTSYGLGTDAFRQVCVAQFSNVKGRSFTKPNHVVVKNWEMVETISITNNHAKKLYKKFLPGPLTLILKKKKIVPDFLVAGLDTIGIRIPDCKVTKLMSSLFGSPYTTSSANRQGEASPYSISELKKVLDLDKVDLILDAGKLSYTSPSTIVDVSSDNIKILREGPITPQQIFNVLS